MEITLTHQEKQLCRMALSAKVTHFLRVGVPEQAEHYHKVFQKFGGVTRLDEWQGQEEVPS